MQQTPQSQYGAALTLKSISNIVEFISDGFVALDTEWRFTYVNKKAVELFRKLPDDLIGKNIWEEFPELMGQQLFTACHQAVKEQTPVHFEEYYSAANRWFEDRIYPSIEGLFIFFQNITDRKQAETAVRDSEARLRQVIDLVPHFVFAKNRRGQFILVNKAVAGAYGTSVENLIGKTDADYNPDANEVEHFLRDDNEVMDRGRPKDIPEEKITDSMGKVRYLHTIKIPYKLAVTREDAVLGVSIDLTERRRAETALRGSELQYRATIDSMDDMIHVVDADLRFVLVNQTFRKWNEKLCLETEVIGQTVFEIFPFLSEKIHDEYRRVFETGEILVTEESTTIGEIEIISETRKVPVFDGDKVVKIVTIIRDITERKRTEEALRQSEERFRSMIQNSSDMITIHDNRGILVYATPSIERILGYKPEDMIGKNPLEYVHPDDLTIAGSALEDVFQYRNRGIPTEFRFRHADGSWKYLESVAINLLNRPEIKGIILTSRDITERKRAEAEILLSHEQLRNLSARLHAVREEESTRIAREIHDELGQTLTALKMDLSFFEELVFEKKSEARDIAMKNKIDSMSKLIDSAICSVRRISTELRPAVLDSMGLQAALEWQAEEFQHRTGIKCDCTLMDTALKLDRDRSTAVFRIFQESLTNVARHSKASKVKINLVKEADNLILEIKDNGKGISESEMHKKDSFGLLGMKERASVYDGSIEIQGVRGKGTSVVVKIPLVN